MRTLMTDFRLEKWYLDCVSSDGTVFIAYAARLKWGPIGLCYGATITRAKDGRLIQRQSLSFGRLNRGRGSISWCNDGLKASGEWTGGEPIAKTVVVDEPSGRIEWQCLSANAAVDVRTDGRAMTGTGYVEKLSMTIPPWKLPFTELRWGRFISDDRSDYVVWIDLRGGTQRNWIWVSSGEADLELWRNLPDDELRARLCKLPGVGAKVANCVMLFAYERLRAFPIDVWIERVLRQKYFPRRKVTDKKLRTFCDSYFGEHGGYAQQYLFHHARKTTARVVKARGDNSPRCVSHQDRGPRRFSDISRAAALAAPNL